MVQVQTFYELAPISLMSSVTCVINLIQECSTYKIFIMKRIDIFLAVVWIAIYEGCSKYNVTCIGAHIAEVLLFILICSALQNTLHQPEHTFLAIQSIFGSIFHTLQWGHLSDTDKQQIQGHFSNCISFQINDI